jgi:hypothetical protein
MDEAMNDGSPSVPVRDAEWLAHRYDAVGDAVHFRHVPRPRHSEVPFLTDEYLGDGAVQPIPFNGAVAQAPAGRLHFIFHSAFCASTLLTRAFDVPGLAMGLSEPVILNDVVGFRRRGGDPRAVARLLSGSMTLMARPFGPGEMVVAKPSNILNPLAAAMLRLRPDARALLLYAPLPVFLASVARKGMWCRLWAREHLEGLLTDQAVDLGFTARDLFRQTDLQVAAVGWLAQHALFAALAAAEPKRVATLDSETLLAGPRQVLGALTRHYHAEAGEAVIEKMAAGPAFSRHSKHGQAFNPAERAREQDAAAKAHGDEIASVAEWAGAVAANAGVSMTLPQPLLAQPLAG